MTQEVGSQQLLERHLLEISVFYHRLLGQLKIQEASMILQRLHNAPFSLTLLLERDLIIRESEIQTTT